MISNITVYHASYVIVDKIDLSFSKPYKDFGAGFCVTTNYEQARKFALLISKRKNTNKVYVNKYILSDLNGLDILTFNKVDINWLKCVAGFRNAKQPNYLEDYIKKDVIMGKVADDNTNLVINAYIRGAYGDLNSSEVMRIVIKQLMSDKLTDQICFKSKKSLKKLKYIDAEELIYVKD